MNKKTKKMVRILTIILVVLVCLAVYVAKSQNKDDKQHADQNEKESLVEQGTDQEKLETKEEEVPEKAEIKDKAEATESEWLAAAAVIGISLQYADFEIEEIYVSEEENKETYVVFKSGGEQIAIHSKALSEERKEAGTKDIYTEDLGFSTFDEVQASDVKKENMKKIEIEELDDLIAQSLLVSVYER